MAFRRAFLIATVRQSCTCKPGAGCSVISADRVASGREAPGPDFQLVDMNGHRRSLRDYAGSVSIVFFGYTALPGRVPGASFSESVAGRPQSSGRFASHVQVLFISLDPERGYTAGIAEGLRDLLRSAIHWPHRIHCRDQSPRQLGFSVQFAKVAVLGNDFTVGHSTGTYVLDQTGRLRLVGTLQTSLDDWVHDLQILMGEGFPNGPNSTKK